MKKKRIRSFTKIHMRFCIHFFFKLDKTTESKVIDQAYEEDWSGNRRVLISLQMEWKMNLTWKTNHAIDDNMTVEVMTWKLYGCCHRSVVANISWKA